MNQMISITLVSLVMVIGIIVITLTKDVGLDGGMSISVIGIKYKIKTILMEYI